MRMRNLGGCFAVASCVDALVASGRRMREVARGCTTLRRRMVDFAAVLIAFVAMSVAATAGTSGPVRAWYYDQYGNPIEDCAVVPYGAPCGWMPGAGG